MEIKNIILLFARLKRTIPTTTVGRNIKRLVHEVHRVDDDTTKGIRVRQ